MPQVLNANPIVLDLNALPKRNNTSRTFEESNIEKEDELNLKSRLHELSLTDNYLSADRKNKAHFQPIDSQEIYDLVAPISDPEHPLTLGQLAVVTLKDIQVINPSDRSQLGEIKIIITPTISQCSLATLIGLGIRVRLERCLPGRFRITILLKKGTHQSENQVNKQLNDKERVNAACENPQLLRVIGHMLSTCN